MKKTLFAVLVTLLVTPLVAQIDTEEIYNTPNTYVFGGYNSENFSPFYYIPKFFSKDNSTILYSVAIHFDESENVYCEISILDENFETERTLSLENIDYMYYCDLDEGMHSALPIMLTQNLFNNDEKYEYIRYVGNNEKDSPVRTVQIVSGNEVIHTFNPPSEAIGENDCYECIAILKYRNNYYLFVGFRWGNGGDYNYSGKLYRINRSSVASVLEPIDAEIPFSIMPTVASIGQNINIQLGENTDARQVTIIESDGRIVKQIPISTGQTEITIPTSDLGRGVKVVGVSNRQQNTARRIVIQ